MKARSIAIVAVLLVPCIAVAVTPWYNRTEPRLDGIPFFYWYQLMWAPLSAVCLGIAYMLSSREER